MSEPRPEETGKVRRRTELGKLPLVLFGIFSLWMLWAATAGGEMEAPARSALVILVGAALLWMTEAIPLFATSLLILFAGTVWFVPLSVGHGIELNESDIYGAYFNDLVLLFLGGFVLSAALGHYRIDEWLARKILSRTGGSPKSILLAVLCLSAFMSMWLYNTATAAMMLAMIMPVVRTLPAADPLRKQLVLAVSLACNVGGLGTPIATPPNAIALTYLSQLGLHVSFLQWMLLGLPGVAASITVVYFCLRLLFRTQIEHVELNFAGEAPVFKGACYWTAVIASCTVAAWITGGIHPLSSGTIGLLATIAFFSSKVLPISEIRRLPWDVLLLLGGGLALGTIVMKSGLAHWLIAQIPVSAMGTYGTVLVFGIAALVMSSLMSNTATANLLIPIAMTLPSDRGHITMIAVAMICSLAMVLPISTPPNALAFGTDEVKITAMARVGVVVSLLTTILALTIGYFWWSSLGL